MQVLLWGIENHPGVVHYMWFDDRQQFLLVLRRYEIGKYSETEPSRMSAGRVSASSHFWTVCINVD